MICIPGLYKSVKTNSYWKTISVENGRVKMIQMVEGAIPVECSLGDFETAIETGNMILNDGLSALIMHGANVKNKRK